MKQPSRIPRALLTPLLALGFALSASAQEDRSVATMPSLTGKERLGRKWTDEQRIDNCNVPIDKRGTRPRPAGCVPATAGTDTEHHR
jgi:hypothetical protein